MARRRQSIRDRVAMGLMRIVLPLLVSAAVGSIAEAQGNDVSYRSWRWTKEPSSVRASGLAGAMAAVIDDAGSAEWNAAALTALSKSELLGSVLSQRSGETVFGDPVSARTGVGWVGLAGRLSSRWAVGAYVVEPNPVRIEVASFPRPGVSNEQGFLEGTATDAGFSAAWRVASRLHIGVRVTATHLVIDGAYRLQPAALPSLAVETGAGATRVTPSFGLLYEPSPKVRLGLVRLAGARWRVARTTSISQVVRIGDEYEIRQPTVVSGGVSLRPSPKVLIAAQLDYVRNGEIQVPFPSRAEGVPRQDYGVYAWEPRVGVEASLPLDSASVQFRAGLHWRSTESVSTSDAGLRVSVVSPTTETSAPDAANRAFLLRGVTALLPAAPAPSRSEPRVFPAVGASLVTSSGLRFDIAGRFGGERTALLVGTGLRF